MNQNHIIHEPENKRFMIPIEGSTPAELKYSISADLSLDSGRSVVNFTHTYVPPEHRNKGLAEKLVRSGIAWARERDYRMEASCSYVAKFLTQRNQ